MWASSLAHNIKIITLIVITSPSVPDDISSIEILVDDEGLLAFVQLGVWCLDLLFPTRSEADSIEDEQSISLMSIGEVLLNSVPFNLKSTRLHLFAKNLIYKGSSFL